MAVKCKHERTYYDEKGERCKDCHAYISMTKPRGRKPRG